MSINFISPLSPMLSLREIFQTDKEWQKSWTKELKEFWLGIVSGKPDKEDKRFLKDLERGFKKEMGIKDNEDKQWL